MNTDCRQKLNAYTLIDLVVGLMILALFLAVVAVLPATPHSTRARVSRINCTCNLKQVGLAYKQWALDHHDRYPMEVSVTNGGTMEFVNSGAVWVHFNVMSNELSTPKILSCPADNGRHDSVANTFGTVTQRGQSPFTNDDN